MKYLTVILEAIGLAALITVCFALIVLASAAMGVL